MTINSYPSIGKFFYLGKFRFENFESSRELIDYIHTNFRIGSDVSPLLTKIKGAGADCKVVSREYYSKEDKRVPTHLLYECIYNTGWLYYPPLIEYSVHLNLDKDNKLIDFGIGRQYGGP